MLSLSNIFADAHNCSKGITGLDVPQLELWNIQVIFTNFPKILSISSALFIILYVIFAMQIMSATQRDSFFSVWLKTRFQQLGSIFTKCMVGRIFWQRAILRFWEGAKANLIDCCLKRFISRNSNLLWTSKQTPYVRNSLLNLLIFYQHSLFCSPYYLYILVLIHFLTW